MTYSPKVSSFLDWLPAHTKTDYQLLQEALIKELSNPESEQGLVAALEMRQGFHEPPQAYYSRLRQAYFGYRNKPDMEVELKFKSLFLRNLHKPPYWHSRMSTNKERSVVARLSLWTWKDGL